MWIARLARGSKFGKTAGPSELARAELLAGEQARERRGPDPSDAPVEKLASINCVGVVHFSSG